jgi:hypothetical protein
LELGELAINTYDGKVYIEQDQGAVGVGTTIIVVNPWSVGTGTDTYNTYFTAGNVGVGTTNPGSKLTINGAVQIQQDSGSNNRLIFRGQPGSSYRWNIDNYSSSNEFRIFREDDATAANGFAPFSISTTGTLTANKFSGDGSLLTNLPSSGGSSQWVTTSVGIHTLSNVGIGTTNPTSKLTVSGNASITGILTADQVYTSNNGNGQNIRIGDDFWLGDVNVADTTRFSGAQDSTRAFVIFGSSDAVALGRTGTGPLYYGGNFNVAGVITASSFSGNASSATYATSSGIATYATTAGVSTSVIGGIASVTSLSVSGFATATEFDISGSTNTLNAGGLSVGFGTFNENIAVSGVTRSQHLFITGVSTFQGTVNLGDAITDQIIYTGRINSDIIPLSDNNVDVGTTSNRWRSVNVGSLIRTSNLLVTGVTTVTGITTTQHLRVTGFTTVSNASITGVATVGSNLAVAGVTTTQHLRVTGFTTVSNASITGVATVGSNLAVAGVTTTQHLQITGVSTFAGIATHTASIFGTQANFSGIVTATEFDISGSTNTLNAGGLNVGVATLGTLTVTGVTTTQHFRATGVSTVVNLNATGIITASSGIQGIGIYSGGTSISTGIITALNFVGSGNTFAVVGNRVDISISGGGSQVSVSTVAPTSPTEGSLWYNTNLGRTFVYYDDGSSQQWVDVAPFNQGGTNSTVTVSSSAPTSPVEGQLWYSTLLARTFIYYSDGTSSQWVDAAPFNTQTVNKTLTIGTRSTAGTLTLVGTGLTISLRSGVGTASF